MLKRQRWVRSWEIQGSKGETWVVSQDREGNFGCSCPVWKFKRSECKHIQEIKGQLEYRKEMGPMGPVNGKPSYVLAMVGRPTLKAETNELLVPLVRIGDIHMEATICHNMLKHGYTMDEIRAIRNIRPDHLNAKKIREYIETYGEASYENNADIEGPTGGDGPGQ